METQVSAGTSSSVLDYVLLEQIVNIRPRSVYDFGAGAGKIGRLVKGVFPSCRVTAVEGFFETVKFLRAHGVYDNVISCVIQDWFEGCAPDFKGDLAIFGDVLEHMTPWEIHQVVRAALRHFKHVLILTPLHEIFQEDNYGNKLEIHRTYVTQDFFDEYGVLEKHIAQDGEWQIMNVHLAEAPVRKPLYKRAAEAVFHRAMLILQPLGLAKAFTVAMRKMFYRFKWVLR